jgi:cell division transport system permease protein
MKIHIPFLSKQKRRVVGRAEKRQYDLPLHRGSGSGFLTLLTGLMAFLAMLALCASFLLSALTERWSSGLENKITVEIPARDINGDLMAQDKVDALTLRITETLRQIDGVESVTILDRPAIIKLVEPWLGTALNQTDIPLPGILTVSLQQSDTKTMQSIHAALRSVSQSARMDTHEDWVRDILRFTGALQFAAMVLVMVITATTLTAIAGAVKARMAIHHAEVEILHIMGASDQYITRQFQRHALLLSLKGACLGALCALTVIWIIGLIAGEMGISILPSFRFELSHYIILCLAPALISILSMLTARWTVLKSLAAFP